MKCRDAFVRPCSETYRPIFEQSSAEYRIAGFFRRNLFSRISRISASRENIFREILGTTPSSRSAATWVWSGFGLIAKTFFEKFAPVSNSRKYRSAKKPDYKVCGVVLFARLGAGPASSVSLVRLTTRLLASTRASSATMAYRPRRGQTCRESEIAQQKLNLDDIHVLT